jgi:hypothetical protein
MSSDDEYKDWRARVLSSEGTQVSTGPVVGGTPDIADGAKADTDPLAPHLQEIARQGRTS